MSKKTAEKKVPTLVVEKMIVVEFIICCRCGKNWQRMPILPFRCPFCKSPSWNTHPASIRFRSGKYGFSALKIGVPLAFPWFKLPNGEHDDEANRRRVRALSQFCKRHFMEYSYTAEMGTGLVITRKT